MTAPLQRTEARTKGKITNCFVHRAVLGSLTPPSQSIRERSRPHCSEGPLLTFNSLTSAQSIPSRLLAHCRGPCTPPQSISGEKRTWSAITPPSLSTFLQQNLAANTLGLILTKSSLRTCEHQLLCDQVLHSIFLVILHQVSHRRIPSSFPQYCRLSA
jgi:hypothetical protein